jgi:hypothetical protein
MKGNTMLPKSTLSYGLGAAAMLALSLAAHAAHANSNSIRYGYIPLDQATVPPPYVANNFTPSAILGGGIVVGTIFDASFTTEAVAVWRNGTISIGQAGTAVVANDFDLIGGASPSSQAALFTGNSTLLIPRLAGEVTASVVGLGLGGLALVQSVDASSDDTYAYDFAGRETVIPFGLPDPVFGGFMNQLGQVAVTKEESATDPFLRGYRYDPLRKTTTPLDPFAGDPTDQLALVQGINNRGEVLGYSFTNFTNPSYHERVGLWNLAGVFQPYYYETISTSALFFNDFDQIVITNLAFFGPGVGTSYLVPQPGTRLDLASLVVNVPSGLSLISVVGIDNEGDIIGIASDAAYVNFYPFLLTPLADGRSNPGEVETHGCQFPNTILQDFMNRFSHHK